MMHTFMHTKVHMCTFLSCWHSAGADDHIECVEKLHKVSRNAAKVQCNVTFLVL